MYSAYSSSQTHLFLKPFIFLILTSGIFFLRSAMHYHYDAFLRSYLGREVQHALPEKIK